MKMGIGMRGLSGGPLFASDSAPITPKPRIAFDDNGSPIDNTRDMGSDVGRFYVANVENEADWTVTITNNAYAENYEGGGGWIVAAQDFYELVGTAFSVDVTAVNNNDATTLTKTFNFTIAQADDVDAYLQYQGNATFNEGEYDDQQIGRIRVRNSLFTDWVRAVDLPGWSFQGEYLYFTGTLEPGPLTVNVTATSVYADRTITLPIELTIAEIPKLFFTPANGGNIPENSGTGTVVGQLSTSLPNPQVGSWQYGILSQDEGGYITVDVNTGQVSVLAPPDYETVQSINVQFGALLGQDMITKTYTFHVTNVVEGTLAPTTATISDNIVSGATVAQLTGFDVGANEQIASISPNDGRFSFTADKVIAGLSAVSAGTVNLSVTTTAGRTLNLAVTVNASKVTIQVASRAEQNNYISGALTTANQKNGGRLRAWFSHDCDNLQIGYNGYYVADINGSNICVETPLANNYDIRVSLEYNGQSKLFKWSGADLRTILAGEDLALSDKLAASMFGVSKFTKGDQFWIRYERVTPVGGNMLYHYNQANSPAIDGERFFNGAISSTDMLSATGDWPVSGGWTATSTVFLPSLILGEVGVATPHMATVVVGASIEHGAGDSGRGDGVNGNGGYIRRGFALNKGARISLMKQGESAKSFLANCAKRRKYIKYATHAFCGHGGNDYSYGDAVGTAQANIEAVWDLIKTERADMQIFAIPLFPKTDSPNGWIAPSDQTPRAGFAIGGAYRDVINNYALSKVGSKLAGVFSFDLSASMVAHGGPRDRMRVDLGKASTDGTHPSSFLHATMANELSDKIETIRYNYEQASEAAAGIWFLDDFESNPGPLVGRSAQIGGKHYPASDGDIVARMAVSGGVMKQSSAGTGAGYDNVLLPDKAQFLACEFIWSTGNQPAVMGVYPYAGSGDPVANAAALRLIHLFMSQNSLVPQLGHSGYFPTGGANYPFEWVGAPNSFALTVGQRYRLEVVIQDTWVFMELFNSSSVSLAKAEASDKLVPLLVGRGAFLAETFDNLMGYDKVEARKAALRTVPILVAPIRTTFPGPTLDIALEVSMYSGGAVAMINNGPGARVTTGAATGSGCMVRVGAIAVGDIVRICADVSALTKPTKCAIAPVIPAAPISNNGQPTDYFTQVGRNIIELQATAANSDAAAVIGADGTGAGSFDLKGLSVFVKKAAA